MSFPVAPTHCECCPLCQQGMSLSHPLWGPSPPTHQVLSPTVFYKRILYQIKIACVQSFNYKPFIQERSRTRGAELRAHQLYLTLQRWKILNLELGAPLSYTNLSSREQRGVSDQELSHMDPQRETSRTLILSNRVTWAAATGPHKETQIPASR